MFDHLCACLKARRQGGRYHRPGFATRINCTFIQQKNTYPILKQQSWDIIYGFSKKIEEWIPTYLYHCAACLLWGPCAEHCEVLAIAFAPPLLLPWSRADLCRTIHTRWCWGELPWGWNSAYLLCVFSQVILVRFWKNVRKKIIVESSKLRNWKRKTLATPLSG